jgi:exoribonuclease R
MIQINIFDRNYQQVTYDSLLEKNIQPQPIKSPFKHKLFNKDIFTYDTSNHKINIVHSPIRSQKDIPAVLILDGNKTYGRRKDKLLYRCIPNDITIPSFLVPYDTKSMPFSKVVFNAYVTITFQSWKEEEKHPFATISQFIGSVNVTDNFYEYQIYCRYLNYSLQKMSRDTSKSIEKYAELLEKKEILKKYPQIEDRTDTKKWFVFSVDPEKSTDLDDAYSVVILNNNSECNSDSDKEYLLSVYIPNVPIYMDILQLWDSLSERVSTIYLPNKKRPMLPPILSESILSLLSNSSPKCAFTMDIYIHHNEITKIEFKNTIVKISKNYAYDEPALINDINYKLLYNLTQTLLITQNNKYKYIDEIKDSHDVVAYLMILMNYMCAVSLKEGCCGIFRATVDKSVTETDLNGYKSEDKKSCDVLYNTNNNIDNIEDKEVRNFLKIWNSNTSGAYVLYSDTNEKGLYHNVLNMEAYIHITSPIRRLIDILNMIQFQKMSGIINLSDQAEKFYMTKCDDLCNINMKIKQTRKLQHDCELLGLFVSSQEVLTKKYKGYCFDKKEYLNINTNKMMNGYFEYKVYLPELKIVSKVVTDKNMDEYDMNMYSLYLFEDENRFNKKIRVSLCK